MKKQIKVMDTSFRDGFQSCIGARVFTKDYLPALEAAKAAGIRHFETAGGALFQSLVFYANENPFTNMDLVRKTLGNDVTLQSLARGINVVCLKSQPSDIIDLHARMFKKHGIDVIRNFDALNDVNNLTYSGQCIKNAGAKHEVTVTMMGLPPKTPGAENAHTPEFYTKVLRNILDKGVPFDSVAFKDASGTSTPQTVYETIKAARELLGNDVHIRFHSHETAGASVQMYRAALDGGADGLDLAMAPLSGGTCQPDHITMWHALRGTNYDLGYDIDKMIEAQKVLKDCLKDYFMPPEATTVDPMIVFSPMPGGALTANTQMMRDNGVLDRYPEVIAAMREVVAKGGFGTSVTPVSQFYFQQAFNNVMFGPWEKMAEGYGKMVLGYFGKTPTEPDVEIIKIASEKLNLAPTTQSPLEINDQNFEIGVEATTRILLENNLEVNEENIMLAAACEDKGILFLQGKATANVRKMDKATHEKCEMNTEAPNGYTVGVNGKNYAVELKGDKAVVNGKTYDITVKEGVETASVASVSGDATPVNAALPGNVLRIEVEAGDSVQEGDVLLVIEAMKMETEIKSPKTGTVASVEVEAGAHVKNGQVLVTVG